MRGWWQELAGLVLPADCAGCGAPRVVLCARCRAALDGGGVGRARPTAPPSGLPVVHAGAVYGDAVRAVVLAHKERGALPLAGPLGAALAAAVLAGAAWSGREAGEGAGERAAVVLVPVPSARHRVRARGHDPPPQPQYGRS
ncbi:ComF family protein, partial [Streptomyces sp. A1136]